MIKHINILKFNIVRSSIIVSIVFLLFSISFLFIFFNKISRDSLIEQVQHRQQLATRTGAKSLSSFLRAVGRNVVVVADDPSQTRLDNFIKNWTNEGVTGVVAINKDGYVFAASNRSEKNEIGQKVIERGYFNWAKTAKKGDYLIASPIVSKFGPTKGQFIITISSPIFDSNNEFNGVVTSAVLVSEFFDNYFDGIKVLDNSNIYLVTQDGQIVYTDNDIARNKSLSDLLEKDFVGKKKVLEIIEKELNNREDMKLKIAIPNFNDNYKLEPYLISASPVNLNDNLWKVVIAVPEKELNLFTYNYFNKQITAIFIILTIFTLLTIRLSARSGYERAVTDEHKLHNLK